MNNFYEDLENAYTTNDSNILYKLSQSKIAAVRRAVAENENTPPKTLSYLSHDREWEIRRTIEDRKYF